MRSRRTAIGGGAALGHGWAMDVRDHFRGQAAACQRLGSPFTARLLELAATRLDGSDGVGRAVLGWAGDPDADALAVLAGGLHALVMSGSSPGLATVYPSATGGAGEVDDDRLWAA